MSNKTILLCRHCGNRTPHDLRYTHQYKETIYTDDGNEYQIDEWYFLVCCETCGNASLYGNWEGAVDPMDLTEAYLLYPTRKDLPEVVPNTIRESYKEASRISKFLPNAFAVQIRKALEFICVEQGMKKGTLQERLNKLSESGIIPSTLADMADAIRLLGNIGAHADIQGVSKEEADYIDDFFRAVIEYVYIAPAKLGKLSKKLR